MRVAFRVDASAQIGTGHLIRCLTLADALSLRGAAIRFICRRLPDMLRQRLVAQGHEVAMLDEARTTVPDADLSHSNWLEVSRAQDADDTLQALSDTAWDWVIVDHYGLDVRWEKTLRRAATRIMAIDDLADRQHVCDLLLDQNYVADMDNRYVDRLPAAATRLIGPRYALLHESYAQLHPNVRPRVAIQRILIFFGGADADNLTTRALEAVLSLQNSDLEIDVVLPLNGICSDEIAQLAAGRNKVTCHRDLPTLAPLMAKSDLAIGAIGSTTWERLCLGLPTIAVTMAKNQYEVATALHQAGLIVWLGSSQSVTTASIAQALSRVTTSADLAVWSAKCKGVCDGRGTQRVVEHLLSQVGLPV